MSRDRSVNHPVGTFAAEFGLTRDVLRRILAEAKVQPVGKRAGHPVYRLRDVYAAILQQQQPEAMNPHARLALAKAIQVEDQIKRSRGELCDAVDVERQYAFLMMLVVRAFETAVDNLERDIELTPQQAEALEKHFDQCRLNLIDDIRDEKGNGK